MNPSIEETRSLTSKKVMEDFSKLDFAAQDWQIVNEDQQLKTKNFRLI